MNLLGVTGAINAVSGIAGKFFGNKEAKETNIHDEQMAAYEAMASENYDRTNRTWWDSFVDGLNRLPRPLLAFMVIGCLIWAPIDPYGYAAAMRAYELTPEWMAIIFGQIILMFVGGRMLDNWKMGKGKSAKEVKAIMDEIQELKAMGSEKAQEAQGEVLTSQPVVAGDPYEEVPGRLSNAALEAELKDTSKPMSLPAIVEWNRRRQGND